MDCPLHQQALRNPDQPFLISASETLSFREADELASRFQADLLPYSIVATAVPNSLQWVCFLFACLREQVTIASLNIRLPEARIQTCCEFLGSETLFHNLPKPGKKTFGDRQVTAEQTATIVFTSGSSGEPKAVPHTLGNHLASARAANQHAPLLPGDRWLCSLPFYHVGGLAILFRCLLAGASICFPEPGESLSDSLQRFKPSHLSLVPTQLIRLLREKTPAGLKRILLGGAPVPQSLIEEAAQQGLPVAASYGMTETASQIAATAPGAPVTGAGTILPHAEVKISQNNEILIRGASVSKACTHADGWLHSGDTGRFENGILFVDGRLDRQFISGGENIQPEQIEQALMSLKGISQAVVTPVKDSEFGQRPKAFLDVDWQEEWELLLRKSLPGYMIPVSFERLPENVGLKPKLKDFG